MIDLDRLEARAREQVRELGTTVAIMPGELLELIRMARSNIPTGEADDGNEKRD